MRVRAPRGGDAGCIAAIYNQGIEDRIATFETRLRTADDVVPWCEGANTLVAEDENTVIGFAVLHPYSSRECYAGVAEVSIYVDRTARGRGAGSLLLTELIRHAARHGYWKLIGRIFPENRASRALVSHCGFREVGVHEKHARLDGIWRDVVLVERLL